MKEKDLLTKWKERSFSWSQLSSWEYDKMQWYKRYYLGEKEKESKEVAFGKNTGERLASDPSFMPSIPRETIMEHGITAKLGSITLVGHFDSYDEETKTLLEYKSGKKPWDQKRVDEHGQLTMYCLLLWLDKKVKPEDVKISLHWIPTEASYSSLDEFINGKESISAIPVDPYTFYTKRTMRDILLFGSRIKKARKDMEAFIHNQTLAISENVR